MTDRRHRDLALTLLGKTDVLVLSCQLSRDFVAQLFARRFLANRQPLLELISTDHESEEALQDTLDQLNPVPSPVYSWARARARWSRHRNEVYTDRPIILNAHTQVREGPDGNLRGVYSFDIVANDAAGRPGSNLDPSVVRLEQGVLDTTAETLLTSGAGRWTAGNGQTVSSVSEMYRRASAQGIEWLTIRSVSDPAWQKLELGADARARISQDLAAGYVVVAPKRAVMLDGRAAQGWWRVDPRNGQSLGVDDRGWGVTMVEYAFKLSIIAANLALCTAEVAQVAGDMRSPRGAFLGGLLMGLCFVGGGAAATGLGGGGEMMFLAGEFFDVIGSGVGFFFGK